MKTNKSKIILTIAFLSGASAVIFGAFGAHFLRDFLEAHARTETFKTAVYYQFIHSIMLAFNGKWLSDAESRYATLSSVFFIMGIILFSGSLYLLCLFNLIGIGLLTPFGGIMLIAGWLVWLFELWDKKHVNASSRGLH